MRKKSLFLVLFFICFMCFHTVSYADLLYQYPDSDIFIRLGGLNRFQGEDASTMEDAQKIEFQMAGCDYMSSKELSKKEREMLIKHNFWFSFYLVESDFNTMFTKAFFYRPVIDKLRDIKDGSLDTTIKGELISSTVVLDYSHWHFSSLSGTFDDEINDMIPSYYNTGFLQIISPVSCNITIWNAELNRYYRLYVTKNVPLLVELKCGSYHIVECNDMIVKNRVVDDGEDTLPYNNRIIISSSRTKDNPYLVELEKFTTKYNLKDYDFVEEKETERPTFIPDEIPTEQTQIKDKITDKEKQNKSVYFITIFSTIAFLLLIIFITIYVIIKVKNFKNEQT